jgi:tripartite-type tricarboxylate transporter receptor subunit TctC
LLQTLAFSIALDPTMQLRAKYHAVIVAALLSFQAATTLAQPAFPERSVRIIVAFGVGGTTDVLARLLGQKLGERWHEPVVIENKPGASGNVAAVAVAQAEHDGYTLLLATQSLAVNVTTLPNRQIDPLGDFAPVTLLARAPSVLIVPPKAPHATLADLVAYSKQHPQELTYGSAGVGTVGHLGAEMLKQQTGLSATHVPYNGATTQAYVDISSGRLSFMLPTIAGYIPQIKAGSFRALAVSGDRRLDALPQVPTFAEAGAPDFVAPSWYGLFAPKDTPSDVIAKLSADVRAVLSDRDVRARCDDIGFVLVGSSPDELGALVRDEIRKWGGILHAGEQPSLHTGQP